MSTMEPGSTGPYSQHDRPANPSQQAAPEKGSPVLGWIALGCAVVALVLSVVTTAVGFGLQTSASMSGYSVSLYQSTVLRMTPAVPALAAIVLGVIAMVRRQCGRIVGAVACGSGIMIMVPLIAMLIGYGIARLM